MPTTCAYCAGDAVEQCSMCEKPICTDHTQKALPYLALGEMVKTIWQTLWKAPGTLPALLADPGEEECFCPECIRINSERRVQEQRKFFYIALAALIVCAAIIYLLIRFL
jgi:hypothetical protein